MRFKYWFLAIALGSSCVINALAGQTMDDFELKDWKLASTSTTAELGAQCDVLLEARLLGVPLNNFIFLGLKNTSGHVLYFKTSEVRFILSSGIERSPSAYYLRDDIELKPNETIKAFLLFPEKSDFEGLQSLEMEIPFFDETEKPINCSAHLKFARQENQKELQSSSITYTGFDLDLGLGSTLFRGQLGNVGGRGLTGEVGFDFYPGVHNGFFFNFLFEGFSQPNYAWVSQATNTALDTSRNLLGVSFFGGYVRRDFISEKLSLTWRAGLGDYSLDYTPAGSDSTTSQDNFAVIGQVGFDYQLAKKAFGFWKGAYSVGIAFNDIWIPNGKINGGPSISGQDGSWLLRFKMGF